MTSTTKPAHTPTLAPKWAGEFQNFNHWVNTASRQLTGRTGSVGEKLEPICVDTLGRRCNVGKDFNRARDENTFPIRYFWECEPAVNAHAAMLAALKDARQCILADQGKAQFPCDPDEMLTRIDAALQQAGDGNG